MSHRLSTLLYQHRARRAIARAKREQVRERIAADRARRAAREARIQAEAKAIDDWLGEQAYQD